MNGFWSDTDLSARAPAQLRIDLGAVRDNYRLLQGRVSGRCGAAVKANAYGLGTTHVAPALLDAGCRDLFVAHLDEGLALRHLARPDTTIYVLNGIAAGAERDSLAAGVMVELIGPNQTLDAFAEAAGTIGYEVLTGLGNRFERIYVTRDFRNQETER